MTGANRYLSRLVRQLLGTGTALALFSAFCCLAADQQETSAARRKAESVFQAAMETFYRDHSLQELREGLKRSTEADQTYVQPHFNLALLAESEHDWDTAIKEFQIVSNLGTDVALAAKALQEIKRLQEVRDAWKTPAGKQKVEYDDSLSKARAFLQANRFGDAVAEAEKATQIDDSGFEAYCVQALALASMGRYTEASVILQKASKYSPEEKRDSLQKVIEEIDTARRFSELVDTASELLTSGKYTDAALDYLAAWKLNPDRDDCRLRAALAYTLDKRWKEAEALLNQLTVSKNLSVAREATTQLAALRSLQQNEASSPAMERLMREQEDLVKQANSEARELASGTPLPTTTTSTDTRQGQPTGTPLTPPQSTIEHISQAESQLTSVYSQIRSGLTASQKEALKNDEIQWIKTKDSLSAEQKLSSIQNRIRTLQQRYGAVQSSNSSAAGDKDLNAQLAAAEQDLTVVYARIRKQLTPDQKEDLKQDEIRWIAKKDSMPAAQKLAEIQARIQALRQRYGD